MIFQTWFLVDGEADVEVYFEYGYGMSFVYVRIGLRFTGVDFFKIDFLS